MKNEYPLAEKHIYKWSEIAINRLSYLGDAIEVDGDKQIVVVFVFKKVI